MEIKRQIVESKNPPSNREVWWFDTNTEVLKRSLGGSWVPVVESITPSIKPTTVIKTTYEEVRELYNSGKMDPNVKYQFDYEYYDLYHDLRAYFKDLIIYLDGSTVKAEYTGVLPIHDEHLDIGDTLVYDKSFTADFIFDSIITNSDYYECKRPRYTIDTECIISNMNYAEYFVKPLTENSIPHRLIINGDDSASIEFYNIVVLSDDRGKYHLIYDNHNIYYDTVNNTWSVENNAKYTPLAAIVNVKYDDGTFHKIFIDRYSTTDGGVYQVSMSVLMRINFYNGDLDTIVEHDYELREIGNLSCGISFTDINKFIYELYNKANIHEIYLGDFLAIEFYNNIYWLECVNLLE